ncbi:glycoside hydrolase family 16 protein [Aestuariibaculum sediminum]|uniref:Glycoside hydrolase family 16 protein n=1 Tax=Aestuariibaculum sediminum TaxID=2770637 RepID=A0A8J6Q3H6_9FLAO|nr:glycoside hydrolase family 16 protein [Aestuariibaculum sediminum]MBD0833674.1 glycoside hydrolase family 16 protein [Aestuariibaculum sediminum]
MKEVFRNFIIITITCLFTSCYFKDTISKERNTANYILVFEDQFEDFKPEYWSLYPSQNTFSPWNRYVVNDSSLAEVKNGHLHIKARWNNEKDLPETGAIQTKDKFSFKYGKIEVRAKFSRSGQGGWPAIWLMPQNPLFPGWPDGGEIDIMERLNNDTFVHQVVHQSDNKLNSISIGKTPEILPADYNIYSVVKLPYRIEFYINHELTMVYEPKDDFVKRWPFETDYYIILNHACADKGQSGIDFWPGKVNATEGFPYEMVIDYVKVWKLVDENQKK